MADIISSLYVTFPPQFRRVDLQMPLFCMNVLVIYTRDARHAVVAFRRWLEGLFGVLVLQVICYDVARVCMSLGGTCNEDIPLDRSWEDTKETIVDMFA